LIPAVYVGDKKIAGRRELSAPRTWLAQLEYYFGAMKLPSITVGEIKKFEIWLSKIPARSTIVEDEDGKLIEKTLNETPHSISGRNFLILLRARDGIEPPTHG
jgi:hypothetical protein